jgi:hypothetical protein
MFLNEARVFIRRTHLHAIARSTNGNGVAALGQVRSQISKLSAA